MRLEQNASRLAIFAYYDKDGVVDDYIPYLLEQVGRFCKRQIVVVNGALNDAGRKKLESCCDEVICRENSGFDITAYKETLLRLQDSWAQYDELLLYNQTIFGPVCSLQPMFDEMASRDVDFWGLTRHKGAHAASWDDTQPIPPHVQSFFFAVRKSMFTDPRFLAYWTDLPEIRTYWDAVGKHEVLFTQHFAQMGFVWDVYVSTQDLECYNDYPLMGMPVTLMEQRGCPFFKRKNFLVPRFEYTTVPQGRATQELYEYLRDKTDYPVQLVFQNLLRTEDLSSVVDALNLYFDAENGDTAQDSTAAVLYFAEENLSPMLARAAMDLPDGTVCYALFASAELEAKWKSALPSGTVCQVISQPAPAVMFGALWQELKKFTYLLYLSGDLPQLLEEFADATSLQTAIDTLRPARATAVLQQHPEIGVLCPPMPSHQETLSLGVNLPEQADAMQALLERADIHVKIRRDRGGIASRGGMFFARTDALAKLTNVPFTGEADVFDGMYPLWEFMPLLAAQDAGYMTGFLYTQQGAITALSNRGAALNSILDMWKEPGMTRYDQIRFRMQGILDFYEERHDQMTLEQAFHAKLTLRQKLWICLQIVLKPETFAKLHKLISHS